jgi:predicted NUDIX family NTP pyrophosphohydrolase
MTKTQSAGLMLYRRINGIIEVFLVHPGGPYWKNKDEGAWSIPKGEFDVNEEPLDAATREFFEETGIQVSGEFLELKSIKQKGGKIVFAWALEKDIDADNITSNLFEIEWPPRSGKFQNFPEVDRAAWFTIDEAKKKINAMQVAFLKELLLKLEN